MKKHIPSLFLSLYCFTALEAVTIAGGTATDLDNALTTVNDFTSGDQTLIIDQTVTLSSQVRAVGSTPTFTWSGTTPDITIQSNGSTQTISGGNTTRGLFIGGATSSASPTVTIQDLIFQNCRAQGGPGGGGGMGAGGGLYVGQSTNATLNNCSFSGCSAVGGIGTGDIARGGGGMRGSGATSVIGEGGGGGGFGNNGSNTGNGAEGGGGGGARGFSDGNASGNAFGTNFDDGGSSGASGCGGVGAQGFAANPAVAGGFGGGGGGGADTFDGANGGFGGGGGGGPTSNTAGNGEFGGGGGSTGNNGTAGDGGFGGGGGRVLSGPNPGSGGFGAGDGTTALAGRGAAFGGSIFLDRDSQLTITGTFSITGSSASVSGVGGNANNVASEGSGALGQGIFMMSSSELIVNSASNISLTQPIQGNQGNERPGASIPTTTGGLRKQGTGTLSLSGDQTYTGETNIEAGELSVGGTLITPVNISENATLSGNVVVTTDPNGNGGTIQCDGILSPGTGGVGTVTATNSINVSNTGVIVADITPTGSSDTIMLSTGTATIDDGATLRVIVNAGNYIDGTTYTIIDGTTSFTPENINVVEVGDLQDQISVVLSQGSMILTVLTNRLFLDQDIASGPPTDVVNAILATTIVPGSDFASVVELLGTLSNSEINPALTSLSAVRFGALEWINARNNSYAADILSQHLFNLCCTARDCCTWSPQAWVAITGNFMNQIKPLDFLRKYHADNIGAMAGVDFCCGSDFIYGAAFGYNHTHLYWKNSGGDGDLNTFYGALYGSWDNCWFTTDISVLGGGTDNDLNRRVTFSTLDRTARSDFWSHFFTAHLGFRSEWNTCFGVLSPFALADYHYYHHNKFKEHGANSINLDVRSKTQHFMRGEAGGRWYFEFQEKCFCWAPYVALSWVGEFPLHKSKQPASFVNQSPLINATSYDSSQQLVSPAGGIKVTHINGASTLLGYKGLYGSKTRVHEFEARFEWAF